MLTVTVNYTLMQIHLFVLKYGLERSLILLWRQKMNWITQWISLIFKKLFSYLKHIANNYWPLTISGYLDQIRLTPETLCLTFCHLMKIYRGWSHLVWSGFAKASNKWPSYCLFASLYTVQNWKNKKIYILSCVIINLVFLYLALFSLNPSSPNIQIQILQTDLHIFP